MSYTYKHVIVIGIDGAGNFYRNAKAPTIRTGWLGRYAKLVESSSKGAIMSK